MAHLRLYNTLTRQLESFRPRDPSRITFYSCGPTVYDDAHIGNFRSFLAADVLRRFLESPLCRLEGEGGSGGSAQASPETGSESRSTHGLENRPTRRVVHVMNITDVGHMTDDDNADGSGEDKMQAAARRLVEAKKSGKLPPGAEGVDPTDQRSIARFYEARFKEDARKLGLKVALDADPSTGGDPTLMPRATESVAGMIAVIRRLVERGHAYAVGPPGRQTVYFAVQSFKPYGALSGNTLEALRSGEGGRIQEAHQAEKRHPGDFLLWKADPAHAMRWPSPWGEGYPGWHIECSAMSAMRLLAADGRDPLTPEDLASLVIDDAMPMIDLHSGGEDNIFPHHECEIAQSCCAFNASPEEADPRRGLYAAHWFHPRFLMVEGAKMSKSKGNFFTPRELFEKGHEPAAVRLELIKTHYRSNANFTEQGLKDSARIVERWRRMVEQADAMPEPAMTNAEFDDMSETCGLVLQEVERELNNDLNVAGALGVINGWVNRLQKPTSHDASLLRRFDAVVGVLSLDRPAAASTDVGVFIPPAAPAPEINALLCGRAAARAAKDFKRSDAIRDQLAAMGYAIKDVAGGKVEVRKA